jgi:hypothetical protein
LVERKKINITELRSGSRRQNVARIRTGLAFGLVKEHGITLAKAVRQLGVTTSAIYKVVKRKGFVHFLLFGNYITIPNFC